MVVSGIVINKFDRNIWYVDPHVPDIYSKLFPNYV